jgi:hypothetical protein
MEMFTYLIEVAGACNLHCPACANGNSQDPRRPRGFMPPELFTAVLEKIRRESPGRETQIYLYNWGEPTLHAELPRLLEIARRLGFPAHLSSNLSAPADLRETVRARPASLRISLSGSSPAVYARTHRGGDIWMVKSNAYRLRSYQASLRSVFPVEILYHKYRDNTGWEMSQIRDLAMELGFVFRSCWAYLAPLERLLAYFHGLQDETVGRTAALFAVSPEEARTVCLKLRGQYPDCPLRATQTAIDFDGAVALCCASFERGNYLPTAFLDCDHDALQKLKYASPLCAACRAQGADIYYQYGGLEEWDAIAASKLCPGAAPHGASARSVPAEAKIGADA